MAGTGRQTEPVDTLIAIAAAVAIAVALTWLFVLVAYAVLRPDGATLKSAVRLVPDVIRLAHRLARRRDLDRGSRIRLWLLLGYLAMPIDVIPDIVPVLGYADDVIVVGLVLRGVIRRSGADAVRRSWPGDPDGLALLARLCRLPELASNHTA